MSTVSIKNNTSNNIAFEARILTMQGQHVTVRASLLAGSTTPVALPIGVTSEMLAASPEVQAEQAKPSPNWSIVAVSSADAVGGLSDYDVFRVVQAAPASATIPLGCANRDMKLTALRLASPGPSGAGESYTISQLLVNGVNVLPVPEQCVLPAAHLAFSPVKQAINLQVKEGDFLSAVTTYVAGAGTLTAMSVEVVGSKA